MQIAQHKSSYVVSLYINIGVATVCILIILGLAYQKNKYSYPSSVAQVIEEEKSIITSEYENPRKILPTNIDDIHAAIAVIRQQSKDQLRDWQIKNANPLFKPEKIIPLFFKQFNGDLTSMTK